MAYRSVFRPGLFQEQVVVVTGGGSGIGRCIAHELAALGAHAVVLGRTEDKLARTVAEIAEDGGSASYQVCDIRDEDVVKRAVGTIVQERGRIHGLVNNAGGQYPSPLVAISRKGFEAVVRTNLLGGFLMSREVFEQSFAHHGGAIVNIVADCERGMPGMAHSGAARAGMINLTKTAAVEWSAAGVRVNAVAPGYIASSGLDTYESSVHELIPILRDNVPLRRFGTEAEVSSAVCFLLSEAASFITGMTLPVDGAAPLASPIDRMTKDRRPVPPYEGFHRAKLPDALR
ncbi:MAG TPA: SDR family oxidoreductase [Polyangiaceae bacterium]|jgi:citronellol/citronellal dehydrogenase|nr:SDR family oxidoreductase [Polyangiaceae bacterium]